MTDTVVWTPTGPRPPIAQYRASILITGDDVGPYTLSWLLADRLHSIAGTALFGRVETITRLSSPDDNDDDEPTDRPAPVWGPPPGICDGPYRPAHAPATDDHLCSYCRQAYLPYADATELVSAAIDEIMVAVNSLGTSGLHGQVLRGEVCDIILAVATRHRGTTP